MLKIACPALRRQTSGTTRFARLSGCSRRDMTNRAKRPANNDVAPQPMAGGSYCLSCGRLMPSPSSNQTESTTPRKYCSASCRSRAKDPSLREYHAELARAFHERLSQGAAGHAITCSEVERAVEVPAGKQDGREEARRAARRLVNFGFASQGVTGEERPVEAVQNGRVVETSFAKGEWGIRWQQK